MAAHATSGSSDPGDRTVPSVALVFGGVDAYRVEMGVELHEHSPPFAESVEAHDAVMPMPLADLLWYPAASAAPPSGLQRAAAVLTIGVGAARVFRSEYEVEVSRYSGRGVGTVAAAVAADLVSLPEALHWLGTEGVPAGEIRRRIEERRAGSPILTAYGEPEELLGAATDVDAVVDVGPGDVEARLLRRAPGRDVPVGSWDSATDRLRVRDHLNRHPFYNPRYLVERTLGELASTRRTPRTADDHARVTELARSLRTVLRRTDLPTSVVRADTEQVSALIGDAVSTWIENGRSKGHSPAEIVASIAALEDETLLPLRRSLGLDTDRLEITERNRPRHAS